MRYTGYELAWLFFCYSFFGWVLETVFAALKQKRFVNRGLINGPLCVLYGVTAVTITVYLQELSGIWLFLGCMIFTTVAEWVAGRLIERFYHERWWDYSALRWNLDGYICLQMSVLWGALGFAAVKWGNYILLTLFSLLPQTLGHILIWITVSIAVLDCAATAVILAGRSKQMKRWEAADAWFARISFRIGKWIFDQVDRRIHKAYPNAAKRESAAPKAGVFADGCGFYKLVMLFFVGAFLGDLTETLYCRVTAGVWMSRSSVVWGPFSLVWGFAIAGATALLYRYRDSSDGFLFAVGTFLGGAYEYLCSVFTELVFGTIFWDYSWMPFNLGGRINLLYCFFWGIAAVVWFKKCYPFVSKWIERIPVRPGKVLTWALLVFMCCNVAVSALAMSRYDERSRGIGARSGWQKTIDEHFPDERMARIYPNAKRVE